MWEVLDEGLDLGVGLGDATHAGLDARLAPLDVHVAADGSCFFVEHLVWEGAPANISNL